MEISAIILLISLAVYIIFVNYRRKKYMLNMISDEFGKKPKKFKEEFDMDFVKLYYKSHKESEGVEGCIDELTWNDLDMDALFRRVNYTSTTFGESYLYSKLREVKYDKNEWIAIEKLVDHLMKNDSLRNTIKLELLNLGKIKEREFIDFVYNPNFNKIKGYYKYPLLAMGLIVSIFSIFFTDKIGILGTIFFICFNILIYQSIKIYLENNFKVMAYLLNSITLCQRLLKIKDNDFSEFRTQIQKALKNFKKLRKIKIYRLALRKRRNFLSDINIITEYIKIFFMIDIIAYQNIVKILTKNKEHLNLIYDLVAKIDFVISLSFYRKSTYGYVIPEFTNSSVMELENIYHPLIDNPIKNSITVDKNIIFTGSNASGKSTFIKAIALNCIMAQSFNMALCSKYRCQFYKVITSMAIRDDILKGDSYFIAELKSLKRLLESLNEDIPTLAFVDEILKGTNTIERISASASILKYVEKTKARILVATHDIELTQMIENGYENYHFRETVTDSEVLFDYKLNYGASTTRNAIKLLEVMKFDSDIVNNANNIYDSFVKTKKWEKLKND